MQQEQTKKQPLYVIILLLLAAEAVFILPFVLPRIFRTTFLESFSISQTELGSCGSVYGIVALVSYFFGGPLADRFKPNLLMSVACKPSYTIWVLGFYNYFSVLGSNDKSNKNLGRNK